MERREKEILTTTIPTREEWFNRFIKGKKIQKETTNSRYFTFTLEAIYALLMTLERYWSAVQSDQEKGMIYDVAVLVCIEF